MTDTELNEQVAKRLGWTSDPKEDLVSDEGMVSSRTYRRGKEMKRYSPESAFGMAGGFRYATDIGAAWEIVEHLKCVLVKEISLTWLRTSGDWSFTINHVCEFADTAPRAICLAFLKSK